MKKEDRNWISPRSTKVTYNFSFLDNFRNGGRKTKRIQVGGGGERKRDNEHFVLHFVSFSLLFIENRTCESHDDLLCRGLDFY